MNDHEVLKMAEETFRNHIMPIGKPDISKYFIIALQISSEGSSALSYLFWAEIGNSTFP